MKKLSLARGVLAAGIVALTAASAEAQPVRPNILIVFDTSTSMLQSGSDGSPLCMNNGQGSRIFRLKQAIRNTIAEVGTDEANLGLARFPQRATPDTNRGCYEGHYINSVNSGTGRGCKTDVADESADGNWFTTDVASQVVTVPVTRTMNPSAADYDPAGANIVAIHKWLDNAEASNGTAMTDPEIRSGGPGTPLANSLFYSRLYFQRYVKPNDPKKACRKDIVILVTDGQETCGGNAPTRAAELYAAGVELYVVVQLGESGTQHDTISSQGSGGKRPQSIKVDFTNPAATKAALLNIIAESVPPSEICNGLDDNCNGVIDELPLPGVGGQCLAPGLTEAMVGRGMCKKGSNVCVNGVISCTGAVGPGTEVCNNLDDNCNGEIDEGFDLGKACDNGLKGACLRRGTTVCKPDGTGVFCDAAAATGTAEICNAIDDDCNGMVDDGTIPGNNMPCGADLGLCKAGTTKCEGGKFVCVGQMSMGSMEKCNGQDDDCDGTIDNNIPGIGGMCGCGMYTVAQLSVGECRPGKLECKGREPLDCEGCVLPRAEICDGKDNDCDGMVDKNADCGPNRSCVGGKCEIPCRDDEFPCPTGYTCDRAVMPPICKSLKCANVTCNTGSVCDEGTGMCKNLCEGVMCPSPQTCDSRTGRCSDCRTTGCEGGQVCINQRCQVSPCATKNCGNDAYCDANGECVPIACSPTCSDGERCVRGKCQVDLCARTLTCGSLEVCDPEKGMCVTDLCKTTGRSCPGQRCVSTTGMCQDDPCKLMKCPTGCFACSVDPAGLGQCLPSTDCRDVTTTVGASGSGCACGVPGTQAQGAGGAGFLALLAALAISLRRRGRR